MLFKNTYGPAVSVILQMATVCLGLGFVCASVKGQGIAESAKARGAPFSQQLVVRDRAGNLVRTLGEPGLYGSGLGLPVLSPDGTRLAVAANAPGSAANSAAHLWVFDLATGGRTRISTAATMRSLVWSPDARQIAFVDRRNGYFDVYLIPSDRTGPEQLAYRPPPGVAVNPTDWSADGSWLSFVSGGVLQVVALNGDGKAVELEREDFIVSGGRFSPDGRFLAYRSNESGRNEIYVRAFDPSAGTFLPEGKWKLSDAGVRGFAWPRAADLYFVSDSGGMMAVSIVTAPAFKAAGPTLLFQAPGALADVSRDGQRFVFAVTVPPPQRRVVTVAPELLAQYAGTYSVSPFEAKAIVTVEDNQLMIARSEGWNGVLKRSLLAESPSAFYFGVTNGDFEFVRDDRGVVTHFIRYNGDGGAKWMRD